ncbi:MAG: peptidylprolyl isomerase [Acholeplasmataceae bacterium]|jgi:peptidyl-prolyl cis-trans isomerase B (cyclophilin B)|nr:peptidylprolyl isomerase [Acholeplasmataceae bacterium]
MKYTSYLKEDHPVVTLKVKNLGDIQIELFPEVAPNTVHQFIALVDRGFYNGLIFHRIIPSFMIQGGWGKEKLSPIKGEFTSNGFKNELRHTRGVISMARTNDPNSQTSQFFIMHDHAPHLDGNYAAFGGVLSGMDVVDKIAKSPRDNQDRPLEDIVIESAQIDLKGKQYPDPIYQ